MVLRCKPPKCTFYKLIFQCLNFYVFYMFRTRWFVFRKTVVYTVMVWYIVCIPVPAVQQVEESIRYSKCKGNSHPITGHEDPEGEQRYSSTLSLTSALESDGWSTPRPGRFTPVKETRYSLYRRLGGPQGRSERAREISPPTGNRSPDHPARSESLY